MKTERPVSLSLSPGKFRWPVTAIASVLHRITGMLLFIGTGYLLFVLDMALASEAGFADAGALLAEPLGKLAMLGVIALIVYHLIAGIKHLLLDMHIGDTMEVASRASWAVFILTGVTVALLGGWLW